MKILQPVNEKTNTYKYFVCPKCGCIIKASNNEYIADTIQSIITYHLICPCCNIDIPEITNKNKLLEIEKLDLVEASINFITGSMPNWNKEG